MEKDAENIKHHKHSISFSLSYTIQSMCSLAIDRISYASISISFMHNKKIRARKRIEKRTPSK